MNIDNQINEILKIAGVEQLNEVSKQEYMNANQFAHNEILFHGTSLFNAYRIFESDTLKGFTVTDSFVGQGKQYQGVSTSRSYEFSQAFPEGIPDTTLAQYRSNYINKESMTPIVVFGLDKNKIKQHNKIVPYDYYKGEDNSRVKGETEYEEVVVGDINNVLSKVSVVILNKDAHLLFDYEELGRFLLYMDNIDYTGEIDWDTLQDMIDSAMENEIKEYDDKNGIYITKDGQALSINEYDDIGFEKAIKEDFPKLPEFYQFLKEKMAYV